MCAHNMVTADANTSGDVTVTFKYASEELSITINGDLTLGSSMMDVMKADDNVEESFGLAYFDQLHYSICDIPPLCRIKNELISRASHVLIP